MSSLRDRLTDVLLATLVGTLAWLAFQRQAPPPLQPVSVPIPQPLPKPPDSKPLRRPRVIEAKVGGKTSPDGKEELQVDLPANLQPKNIGGTDGAGLCTFTSVMYNARIQNCEALKDFQKFTSHFPGGGHPSKMDDMIARCAKAAGLPVPEYIQVESSDLEILKLALKSGRPCGVTYSFSPSGRYGGSRIAHMVCIFHATDNWFCVVDNNFPGTQEWMTPEEFRKTYTGGSGKGWAVILLLPSCAPCPHN